MLLLSQLATHLPSSQKGKFALFWFSLLHVIQILSSPYPGASSGHAATHALPSKKFVCSALSLDASSQVWQAALPKGFSPIGHSATHCLSYVYLGHLLIQ